MLITNAVLTDANVQIEGALRIENGAIADAGDLAPIAGETIYDAKRKWLLPGLVDLNYHLSDPGHKRIETINDSSKNALLGGVTTILAAPDTNPPIENEAIAEYILAKANAAKGARILIAGEIAKEGGKLNDIAKLFSAGASAIKGDTTLDCNLIRRAFEYALTADKYALFTCKNAALESAGAMHDGEIASLLGLSGLPDYAESGEAARLVQLAQAIGVKLVVEAISSARTLNALEPYLSDRLRAQTLLSHLLLTEENCDDFNAACKIFPPLRAKSDRDTLLAGVKNGAISIIASGHLPQDVSSRDRPFELASAGMDISGAFLSLAYTYLIAEGKLTINEFIRAAALNPANILGEPCGALCKGLRADLIVFDPNAEREIAVRDGVAKSFWSGKKVKGAVSAAFVAGERIDFGDA
ncbi:MAG: amidohydrolase family protein [Helicobacteraceae bacterium]|jgi:dihydroorotase|nr:amidohydrolase family protein [Helicobacteraceae bacterium]